MSAEISNEQALSTRVNPCSSSLCRVFFVVLAKLGHSQVAQGFVFFIICYAFALVKNLSFRYFGFALLGIIMSFSGICQFFDLFCDMNDDLESLC